jgi:hypothetical protein
MLPISKFSEASMEAITIAGVAVVLVGGFFSAMDLSYKKQLSL